jgi:hypothetical protein
MDPWLESHWGDIHQAMITYARDALNEHLPAGLRARVEERVYLEVSSERLRRVTPDVRVVEFSAEPERTAGPLPPVRGGAAVAEPILVRIPGDPVTESFIQVVDARSGNRVLTVIEILSPANKIPGTGRDVYLAKQQDLAASDASLVEIDLLRQGKPVTLCPPENIPLERRAPYVVSVSRSWKRLQFEVYPLPLRQRLPVIRVPLRSDLDDAFLDIQSLLIKAYANGGYDTIDYTRDPVPPLDPDDAAWADALLRQQGKR